MKKFILIAAAAVAISAASAVVTPANALTILKPGCCGGFNPHPHPHWGGGFGGGLSIGVGLDAGYRVGGDCYYVNRKVLVPNMGLVIRRQLVCG
jgi:hypothetical protein